MKTLKFIDMTLRQAGPSFGKVLSFKEKLEIARSLDRLRADTIELAPISGSKADQLANRTIASMVQTRISAAVNIADGNVEELENLELVQVKKYGKEYWFVLRQLSEQELKNLKTQANIEYIAMMADINLEEV